MTMVDRAPSGKLPVDQAETTTARESGRSMSSGALVGVGVSAFVDETVFHQLLHWHHFYDKSTPDVGLVSDGLFHAFGYSRSALCMPSTSPASTRRASTIPPSMSWSISTS